MSSPSFPPELARRIVREAEAIQARFPGGFRLVHEPDGRLAWHGAVPVEGRDFPAVVRYPTAYPAVPPTLETPLPLPFGCPHVLERGPRGSRLCWIAPQGRGRRRWDPQRHTAATVLRAAQRWALALLVWQAVGTWPVRDAWNI